MGVEDAWVQKPVTFVGRDGWCNEFPSVGGAGRRRRGGFVDDDYDDVRFERGQTPVVKLGRLFMKIFPGQKSEDGETVGETGVEKVKFITILQGKQGSAWQKLLISHSREAALVDIFHELINGFSVLFVGAVLEDVQIPICAPGYGPLGVDVKFEQVGSFKEANEMGRKHGLLPVIGVIC